MYLVTGEQMMALEKVAIEQWAIPELILMENAGVKLVEEMKSRIHALKGKNITILIGSGNNGGDGLVVARHLYNLGAKVKIFALGKNEYQGSTLVNMKMVEKLPIKIYHVQDETSVHVLKLTLNYTEILIDGIFGTGLNRRVSGRYQEIIELVNKKKCTKIAIDVPSGLQASTGEVLGCCLEADFTVTFGYPKLGQYLNEGPSMCGELIVVDIGIPKECIDQVGVKYQLIERAVMQGVILNRGNNSHKGSFGHVAIVGGSVGMSGAVTLAAQGALRSGVGLVSCLVDERIWSLNASMLPEAMVYPLGSLWQDEFLGLLDKKKAIVFGPGIGNDENKHEKLRVILGIEEIPVLIDADGINALASNQELFELMKQRMGVTVITPHPGEMARLIGVSPAEVQQNRLSIATTFAQKHGIWVVLKGKHTVVADPDGTAYLNPTGNAALAKGGTGDILSGIIGACLAQGITPIDACSIGVFIHGLAGEQVSQEVGMVSSKAGDVIEALSVVFKKEFLTDELQTSMGRN